MGTPTHFTNDDTVMTALDADDGFVDCRGEWQQLGLDDEIEPC